jgi:hypothetical protein
MPTFSRTGAKAGAKKRLCELRYPIENEKKTKKKKIRKHDPYKVN